VLLSGGGTTLQNLLDRSRDGRLNAQVVAVVSSKADAFGVVRAQRANVPATVVERRACGDRADFSKAIFDFCRLHQADLVCMGGFLQLVEIPPDFTNRVMNIHPALIPAFSGKGFHGLAVHRAALEAGVKVSGCTVHFADNEYDHGPIISQRVVPVLDDDTPEQLAARVFGQECEAYPQAISWFAAGRLHLYGRRVRITAESDSSARS
jgi:formyltetrahydrofolate-dependent phosphoribosylglycinamide formyltransferase